MKVIPRFSRSNSVSQGVEISDDIWFELETISSLITLEVVLQSTRMSNINGNVEKRRMRCNIGSYIYIGIYSEPT